VLGLHCTVDAALADATGVGRGLQCAVDATSRHCSRHAKADRVVQESREAAEQVRGLYAVFVSWGCSAQEMLR
jgi:hypothetical protein